MRGRRILATLALLGGCLVGGVVQASSASAHAQIVTSTPADGANLDASPDTITLVMSEAVELRYTKITLTDGRGQQTVLSGITVGDPPAGTVLPEADNGSAATGGETEEPVAITAQLPALAADVYHVAWSTVSSDDLHATNGVLVFGVRTAVPAHAAVAPDPLPDPFEVALRWIALVAVGSAAGAGLLWLLLARERPGPHQPLHGLALPLVGHRLLSLALRGAAIGVVADVTRLVVQAHLAGGGWLGPTAHLLAGGYGLRWVWRVVAAVGIAGLALRARRSRTESSVPERTAARRRMVRGIVALSALYALSVTLTGHAGAGATRHPARVALETAHVTAAMAWVGALVAGALVLWRPVTGPTTASFLGRAAIALFRRLVLARFGVIAATCLAVMVVTGLLLAGTDVATVDALLVSTYGRVLLVKLGLVALAFSAAAATALSVRPQIVPRRAARLVGSLRLRVLLTIEALAAVAVLLAAAALGSATPAVGPSWSAAPQVKPLVSGTVSDLVETVQVAPNRPGRNFVTVDVFDSRRPTPAPIGSVQVLLTGPRGGTSTAVATAQGGGRWLLPTEAMTDAGTWQVSVLVSRPGFPVAAQRYSWVVADPFSSRHPVVVSDRRLAPILTWAAGGVAVLCLLVGGGFAAAQLRGSRRRRSAPPSGASPTQASPLKVVETAATSASPKPVPGSSPGG